ncbi:GNAT family N-acetyltransferase [Isoptericola cucumis]|uniref:GNAT family N-acetyltransferase n=1 Tax=Isoptericola cucumis TaxID=1776856 RepID=UPI0032088BB2
MRCRCREGAGKSAGVARLDRMRGFAEYQPGVQRAPARVQVRAAADVDVAAIEDIQRRAGRAVHPEAYRRAVDAPDRRILVAVATETASALVVVGWGQTHHHTVVTDPAPAGHYLGGVTVDPHWRRRGVAGALIQARIEWIAERASEAFYVVNLRNRASIELHRPWSFAEVARAPRLAGTPFEGGVGLLMRAALPLDGVDRTPIRE